MPEAITKDESAVCPSCGAPGYAGHSPGCSSQAKNNNTEQVFAVSPTIVEQIEQNAPDQTMADTEARQEVFDEQKFQQIALESRKVCAYLKYQNSNDDYHREQMQRLYSDGEACHNAQVDVEDNAEIIKQALGRDVNKNYKLVADMVESSDPALSAVGSEILLSQIDKFQNQVPTLTLLLKRGSLYGADYERTRLLACEQLRDDIRSQQSDLKEGKVSSLDAGLLGAVTMKTSKQEYAEFAPFFVNEWRQGKSDEYERLLAETLSERLGSGKDKALGLIENKFGYTDVNWQQMVDAWKASDGEENYSAIVKNLSSMSRLEGQQQGAPKILMDEFGIRNFARIPDEVLLAQVNEKDDTSKPYGIIMLPSADHNGALYKDSRKYGKLYQEISSEYNIRVVEAGSKMDIARRLIGLDRRYNTDDQGHKISFAIVGGHGDEQSIYFGDDGNDQSKLAVSDLAGGGVRQTKKFFEPGANVVLFSCSTGARGGIGQEMSAMLGARLIAPKGDNRANQLMVDKDADGKLTFDVDYVFGSEDEVSVYESGRVVK